MPKLFVIGDSFSVTPNDDPAMTWVRVAAKELSEKLGQDVAIVNRSIMGAAQDWCWLHLHAWIETGELGPDDYLIVALTHPGRYWYIERLPEISNSNIIDLDRWMSKEEAKAIELFIRHIQRPTIDSINLINRLNYLAYHTLKKGLKKPLIIKCFRQDLHQCETMDELNIAQGSLFEDIQYWEFFEPEKEQGNSYFSGLDCRYNHMCLSNHNILGPRVAESLFSGSILDLKNGYIRDILTPGKLDDQDFCNSELSMKHIEQRKINLSNKFKNTLPWNRRTGIAQISSTTCTGGYRA